MTTKQFVTAAGTLAEVANILREVPVTESANELNEAIEEALTVINTFRGDIPAPDPADSVTVYVPAQADLRDLLNEQLIIIHNDRARPLQIKCQGFQESKPNNLRALRGFDTEGMERIIGFSRIRQIIHLQKGAAAHDWPKN